MYVCSKALSSTTTQWVTIHHQLSRAQGSASTRDAALTLLKSFIFVYCRRDSGSKLNKSLWEQLESISDGQAGHGHAF